MEVTEISFYDNVKGREPYLRENTFPYFKYQTI